MGLGRGIEGGTGGISGRGKEEETAMGNNCDEEGRLERGKGF